MNLKSAFCLLERTGNSLAIIDRQLEALSIFVGDKKEISIEDIQMFSGHSYGYIFELDGSPTLPTSGSLSYWMNASIYFGAAGD